MQPLSETQSKFAKAVMNPCATAPAFVTSHSGPRPLKRFNVYRNNIHASLRGVLEGRFPAVARLVGEEFFHATAQVFISEHPPRSPILMEYGETFSEFLEEFEPVADLPYLPDIARIEWAWNVAYYAQDAEPIPVSELGSIAPEVIAATVFDLHPSLSVVRSHFPAVTIWSANIDKGEPEPIDAGAGGEDAMVLRPDTHVEVRRLPAGGAVFIEALRSSRPLGEAAAEAQAANENFDLQANLTGLFTSGAIIGIAS